MTLYHIRQICYIGLHSIVQVNQNSVQGVYVKGGKSCFSTVNSVFEVIIIIYSFNTYLYCNMPVIHVHMTPDSFKDFKPRLSPRSPLTLELPLRRRRRRRSSLGLLCAFPTVQRLYITLTKSHKHKSALLIFLQGVCHLLLAVCVRVIISLTINVSIN